MSRKAPTYRLGPDFPIKLDAYVERFLEQGFEFFADEFHGLDDYLAEVLSSSSPETLRRTPKEKYLLELISFGIYDRLNRDAFNAAAKTLIVMPDCLALHNPDCEKVDRPHGDVCKRCTGTCQVKHMVDLGAKFGATAVFAKRAQTEQLEYFKEKLGGDIGAIGVACINMLADGMRTAADVGVPTRGVLLNFSGCEHWQDKPCASEFGLRWLESILIEKYGPRD